MIAPSETLPARIGIAGGLGEDGLEHVRLAPYDQLLSNGVLRISVLALMADMIGGWVADRHAEHDWVFTTDLSVRAPALHVPDVIIGTASPLRLGRSAVTAAVELRDGDGNLHAYSHIGFVRVARRHGDDPKPDFVMSAKQWIERPRITGHLDAEAGLQVVDASRGAIQVELTDELRNPAGVMQGAMVALVGEVSAEQLATHHLGAPQVVTDLDVRFLAMGRVGPVHARAEFVGDPRHRTIRVELRDQGMDDRVMTVLLARTEPAPR
ncbi:MAG TPA: hypothetical protein VF183_09890 [Acidimicrobiales bacterium]